MSKIQSLADPHYVSRQYKTACNLNAHIRLHQLFSTHKVGWQRWLFDQFQFPSQGRVLELGCGAGTLWLENICIVTMITVFPHRLAGVAWLSTAC